MEHCENHSGLCVNIDAVKDNLIRHESENADARKEIWAGIDKLRASVENSTKDLTESIRSNNNRIVAWIIGGMGTALVSFLIITLEVVFKK